MSSTTSTVKRRCRDVAVKKKKVKSKASAKAKVEKKSKVKAKSKVAKVAQPKTKAKKVQAAKKKVVKAKPKKAASKVSKPKFAKPVASRRVSTPARPTIDFHKALQPMQDRILVLPQGQGVRTPGGLYMPAMVSERPSRGEVKAVGKG